MIEGENPSWKVSSSKVSKRLRKEVKSRSSDKDDIQLDDDEMSLASQSSAARATEKLRSMGQSMRKTSMTKKISSIFGRGSRPKSIKDSPENLNIVVDVPETKSKNLLPETPDAEAEAEVDLLASPTAVDQPTAELSAVEESSTEEKEAEKVEEPKPPVPEPIAETPVVVPETPKEPVKDEKVESPTYQDDNDGSDEKCCAGPCTIM